MELAALILASIGIIITAATAFGHIYVIMQGFADAERAADAWSRKIIRIVMRIEQVLAKKDP